MKLHMFTIYLYLLVTSILVLALEPPEDQPPSLSTLLLDLKHYCEQRSNEDPELDDFNPMLISALDGACDSVLKLHTNSEPVGIHSALCPVFKKLSF